MEIIKDKGTWMGRMWASPPGVWIPERLEVDETSFLVLPLPHPLLARLLPPSTEGSEGLSVGLKEVPPV